MGSSRFSELLRTVVTGLPTAVMVTSVCIVLLARWAHAALDNPGGFGREFRTLQVGRGFAAGAGVVAILALFATPRGAGVGHDLLMLIVAAWRHAGSRTGARSRGIAPPRSRLDRRHVRKPVAGDARRRAGTLGGGILGCLDRLSGPIRSFAVNATSGCGSAQQD